MRLIRRYKGRMREKEYAESRTQTQYTMYDRYNILFRLYMYDNI